MERTDRVEIEYSDDYARERETQILSVAARLFAERGFEATSMREIAEAVGSSKAGLYHWFRDKDQIFLTLIVRVLEELCETTEAAIARSNDPEEQLRLFVHAHSGYISDHLIFYGAANYGFAGLRNFPGREKVILLRDRHENNLRAILERGLESGAFAYDDVGVVSRTMLSVLTGLARWYRREGSLPMRQIAENILSLFLNGLRRS